MAFYKIVQGTTDQREEVGRMLPGLDELAPEVREKVITAWVTAWRNSSFKSLNDVPHQTMSHVSEVVEFGIAFAREALKHWEGRWNKPLDWQELMQALILHDLDKPLLYSEKSLLLWQIPHGVLGALILNELGFSDNVVSAVATHSMQSPFHPSTAVSYLLHYADLFSTDHRLLEEGQEAFYQKHFR